jgi:hypothetical protein
MTYYIEKLGRIMIELLFHFISSRSDLNKWAKNEEEEERQST